MEEEKKNLDAIIACIMRPELASIAPPPSGILPFGPAADLARVGRIWGCCKTARDIKLTYHGGTSKR